MARPGLALVCDRLCRHLGPNTRTPRTETGIAHQLRRLLDEHTTIPMTLADAAAMLDRTVPHLVRTFTASYGMSPYAYLIGRRIDAARPMLLRGIPPAEVAGAVGFYDQAHLTRHFKRHVSTTPARYARSHAWLRVEASPHCLLVLVGQKASARSLPALASGTVLARLAGRIDRRQRGRQFPWSNGRPKPAVTSDKRRERLGRSRGDRMLPV